MKFLKTLFAGAAISAVTCALALGVAITPAAAKGKKIAVSWKTFQEERWKTDEEAIKAVVEAAGDTYISADAQGSASKQAADIEGLITQGVDVIMVVAYDSDAILPSIKKINDAGIKAIAYDVQFEDPSALYITFDNIGVGRLDGQGDLQGQARGQLRLHQGRQGRPERHLPVQRHHGSAEAGDGRRQDQERLRDLHRRLEARQRAEGNGAVPDQARTTRSTPSSPRMTAWPRAWSRR